MSLRTHLIEHSSMPVGGVSAKTAALCAALVSDEHFDTHQAFVDALCRIECAVARMPNDAHLIVICTHGLEDTGTWLHMDDRLAHQQPDVLPHELIPNARGSVVVYMAVCWGGYPGVVRRFQHGSRPWPTVVGALAPLTASEGNELQDELGNVLKADGLDEANLREKVEAFNAKYLPEYGHPIARIATANGDMFPRQGTAGIAWSLLRDEDDHPVDGLFAVTQVLQNRVKVMFDAVNATISSGRLQLAKGAPVTVGNHFRFKAKRSPCGRYLQAVGDVTFV